MRFYELEDKAANEADKAAGVKNRIIDGGWNGQSESRRQLLATKTSNFKTEQCSRLRTKPAYIRTELADIRTDFRKCA